MLFSVASGAAVIFTPVTHASKGSGLDTFPSTCFSVSRFLRMDLADRTELPDSGVGETFFTTLDGRGDDGIAPDGVCLLISRHNAHGLLDMCGECMAAAAGMSPPALSSLQTQGPSRLEKIWSRLSCGASSMLATMNRSNQLMSMSSRSSLDAHKGFRLALFGLLIVAELLLNQSESKQHPNTRATCIFVTAKLDISACTTTHFAHTAHVQTTDGARRCGFFKDIRRPTHPRCQ